MAFKTILTIGNEQRQLLHFNTCYFKMRNSTICEWSKQNPYGTLDELEIVARNNPYAFRAIGEPFGGIFKVSFEYTDNDDFLYHWLKTTEAKHGTIEFYNGSDEDYPFKRIEFWDAWISDISESFSSVGTSPMTLHGCISPATVRINKSLVFQKNWFITDINQKEGQATDDEKGSITLNRAYWIDEDGKEHENLLLENPVKLYVEFSGDYQQGDSVELEFENGEEEDEWSQVQNFKGTVQEEGILTIEDFKLEANNKE